MMRLSVLSIAVVSVLASGCSSSNPGSGQNGGGIGGGGSGDSASYNYKYDETLNGASCSTQQQTYSNHGDYCRALMDDAANHDCALNMRKQAYQQDCGQDFEERNVFVGSGVGGYDDHLGYNCATASSGDRFPRLRDYCEFLRDERLQKGCHWAWRHDRFEDLGCSGEFSPEPPAPQPPVQPQPQPTASGAPQPEPRPSTLPPEDDTPAVMQELQTAGIQVKIEDPQTEPLPSEKPFRDRLRDFWPVLEQAKDTLIAHKAVLTQVIVTDFTAHSSSGRYMELSVDLSAQEIQGYFSLLDRRLAWEKATGIELDLGIDIYGTETGDKLAVMRHRIELLEANRDAALRVLSGVVTQLKGESYTAYFLSTRELALDMDHFDDEFARYVGPGSPLAGASELFKWADAHSVKILADSELSNEPDSFVRLMKLAAAHRAALEAMVASGGLKEIELQGSATNPSYYDSLAQLTLPGKAAAPDLADTAIDAVAYQLARAKELGAPIRSDSFELDAHYLESIVRLRGAWPVILSKKASIKEIQLGAVSSFDYSVLTIGYEGTADDLAKVLARIPAGNR